MNEDDVRRIIEEVLNRSQYEVGKVPYHEHNGIDSPKLQQTSVPSSGVSQIIAGTNVTISPSGGTGIVTVNSAALTGVTSLSSGTGITLSSSTGAVTITNSGVTSLIAGSNIMLSSATGAVTITSTATGGTLTSVTGTDNLTASTPVNTTHTITHGLGVTPVIVNIVIGDLLTPVPSAGPVSWVSQAGWMYLNGAGSAVGGIFATTAITAGGGGTRTLQAIGFGETSLSSTGSAGGANTGAASITINNFTSTTFDIVYTASQSSGTTAAFVFPGVTWEVIG